MADDNWIEDSFLRFEGVTDEQIATIKAAIPAAEALSGIYPEAAQLTAEAKALVAKAEAFASRAEALIAKVKPALDIILPIVKQRI